MEILHFEKKETVKTMSKEQYMNIFYLLLGDSPFFGWWWVVVDIFWLVVGSGGWWWMVMNIFLLVVGGSGWWWWMVVGGIV